MLCNNRITVEYDSFTRVPINLFALTLMITWWWKDATLKRLDWEIFNLVNDEFEYGSIRQHEEEKRRVEMEAEAKFSSKSERDKYKQAKEPRLIIQHMWNATMEWLLDMRRAMERAKFWSTALTIPELWQYIMNKNQDTWLFDVYYQIYDFGDSWAKIIKSDKTARAVKWVPATLIAHWSPEWLMDWPWADKLRTFLNQWLARRSFICIPDRKEYRSSKIAIMKCKDEEEYMELKLKHRADREKSIENAVALSKMMYNVYNITKCHIEEEIKTEPKIWWAVWEIEFNIQLNATYKTIKMSDRAMFIYDTYKDYWKTKYDPAEYDNHSEWIYWEAKNRNWKAIKLAWVLSAIRDPVWMTINEHDLKCAIHQCEFLWWHVNRFYNNKFDDEYQRLFKFFKNRIWRDVPTQEIRDAKFVWTNKFSLWIKTAIDEADELAEIEGYRIVRPEELKKKYPWVLRAKYYRLELI
jgi:hypothetical protein